MNSTKPDRLLILTASKPQAELLMKQLIERNFHLTLIDSKGGLIQAPLTCLLIGFTKERQQGLLELIKTTCNQHRQFIPVNGLLPGEPASLSIIEAQYGGALIFMMNVERFEQF